MQQNHSKTDSGFTLIEMSIVLVIIGLIIGGVLVGQDLIRAAEIRSVLSDMDKYKTAAYTFQTKYDCLAGDCANATTYFGAENAVPATCQTTASTGTLTCNGNGDGKVGDTASNFYEVFRFWQQLAIAGLIKGQYTGITGSGGVAHHILGVNAPTAAITGSGFSFHYSITVGNTYMPLSASGQKFTIGRQISGTYPTAGLFTPAEAKAFDAKIDDGLPAKGLVVMISKDSTGTPIPWSNAKACSTATSETDYTGSYNITHSTIACAFIIKTEF